MQTVESWQEIIDNLRQFTYLTNSGNSTALNRLSMFFHWYYFPNEKAFAPSKFIGYKGTTLSNYAGKGTGTETQLVLSKYFNKLQKEDSKFNDLYQTLENYIESFDKKISAKILNGTGGIYIPKEEYVNIIPDYSQVLYNSSLKDIESLYAEENLELSEGRKIARLVNIYERNPKLRAIAIQIHGTVCKACEFDFEKIYGELGKNFIEVHHTKPLYKLIEISAINAKEDMTVLCSNCHRMIHRKKENPLGVDELRKLLGKEKR